jgi:hypothetical protein
LLLSSWILDLSFGKRLSLIPDLDPGVKKALDSDSWIQSATLILSKFHISNGKAALSCLRFKLNKKFITAGHDSILRALFECFLPKITRLFYQSPHFFLGEELHSCLHCDRVFAQQRSLKIHLATHRRKSLSRLPVTCEENTRPIVPVARPVVHSPQQHVRSSTRLRLKKRRVYSNSPDITGSESEYEEEETTTKVEKRGKENKRSAGPNVEAKERLEYQEAGNACSGDTPGERTEEVDAKRGTLSRKRSPGEGQVERLKKNL